MKAFNPEQYAMIIGAMKCATGSLYYYLIEHPQICPAAVKEPEYFSEYQPHGVEVDRYDELFDFDQEVHKITLEASTGYSKYPQERNVPRNISEYGITPKLIYIVRNPFDRITSHYNFDRSKPEWNASNIDAPHRIHISNYFMQLEQYREFFPIENIHIVDFDDIRLKPQKILTEIYDFFDIEKGHFPNTFERRNKTKVKNHTIHNFKKKVSGVTKLIPRKIKDILNQPLNYLFPERKRTLTQGEKEKIYNLLAEDMKKFQDTYGFDVSKWGF